MFQPVGDIRALSYLIVYPIIILITLHPNPFGIC